MSIFRRNQRENTPIIDEFQLISRQLEILSREINMLIIFEFDSPCFWRTKKPPMRDPMRIKRDFNDIYTMNFDLGLQSAVHRYCAQIKKIARNYHSIKPSNQFVCIFDMKSRRSCTRCKVLHRSLRCRKNRANDEMLMQPPQLPLDRHGHHRSQASSAPTNEGAHCPSRSFARSFSLAKPSVKQCQSTACLDHLQACAIECFVQ